MEERSVLIKTRDGEYLVVPKDQLTANSPKFRRIFDELKHDEHEIEDFSSEAVKTFIKILENKVLDHLDKDLFREMHKLAVVFEVNWLKQSCRDWLRNEMDIFALEFDDVFLFEECWFMIDKWADDAMMDELVSMFAHGNNESLLSHYLSDITKVKTGQIDALLQLGGTNVRHFLNIIRQNVAGQKHLDPNLKYLLQNFNLALCSEVYEELYLEVMDTLSNLPDISVTDLRSIHQLTTNTARLVRSRKQERIERKSLVLMDYSIFRSLMKRSHTKKYVPENVNGKGLTSIFEVTEVLLGLLFYLENPGIEELELFIASLENICSERKIQKVSRKFLDDSIAALKHSTVDQSDIALMLLNKIKNNNILCTDYENFIIELFDAKSKRYYFIFQHPLANSCTRTDSRCGFILEVKEDVLGLCTDEEEYVSSGLHLHDFISLNDMCCYLIHTGTHDNGVQIIIKSCHNNSLQRYLPNITNWTTTEIHVEYNVGDYLCKL